MSHTTDKIYIDIGSTPHNGVSIVDVQAVLGRGVNDLGLLCSDQEWYENNGTYGLRPAEKVNPLALWKPFRSSEKGFATTASQKAAIIAAGCGFGAYPTYHPITGTTIPHAVWSYLKPRGKGGGDNNSDEWYRITDFAPIGGSLGYYHNAVSPIFADFPYEIKTGGLNNINYILIRIDQSGNTQWWRPDWCISFADLFPSDSAYENYRFAVIFKNSRGTIVAVSPQTMANIRSIQAATVTFEYSDIASLVPTIGDTVEAAVCLIQNTNYSTTETTLLTDYAGTVVSLEIKSGCDRATLTYVGAGSIEGMSGSVTLRMGTKVNTSYPGFSCYYPIEQIDVTLTAGPNWNNLTGVNLVLNMSCNGAMGTETSPGAPQEYRFSLPLTAGQTDNHYSAVYKRGVNGFDAVAYVPSSSNGSLTIAFKAIQGTDANYVTLSAPQSPISLAR